MDYQAWGKEIESAIMKQKIETNERNEKIKNTFQESMNEYRERHGKLWYCSHVDTWVSLEITSIPSLDNVNNLILIQPINVNQTEQDCMETLLKSNKEPISIEEYHKKYCRNIEGKWIYTSILDLKYDNEADDETEDESDSNDSEPVAVIDKSIDFDNLD
tara:strand:+ start:1467 stop:1946 length:480 start_codon:yes stop_codon:yes gene_type:complete